MDQLSLLPGTMNQGDTVGYMNGLVLIVIQNGGVLPCGVLYCIGGTVTPAMTSSSSREAFLVDFIAAKTRTQQ